MEFTPVELTVTINLPHNEEETYNPTIPGSYKDFNALLEWIKSDYPDATMVLIVITF